MLIIGDGERAENVCEDAVIDGDAAANIDPLLFEIDEGLLFLVLVVFFLLVIPVLMVRFVLMLMLMAVTGQAVLGRLLADRDAEKGVVANPAQAG